jgi:hypothetical protein
MIREARPSVEVGVRRFRAACGWWAVAALLCGARLGRIVGHPERIVGRILERRGRVFERHERAVQRVVRWDIERLVERTVQRGFERVFGRIVGGILQRFVERIAG